MQTKRSDERKKLFIVRRTVKITAKILYQNDKEQSKIDPFGGEDYYKTAKTDFFADN